MAKPTKLNNELRKDRAVNTKFTADTFGVTTHQFQNPPFSG
jgi:hypothetical protein